MRKETSTNSLNRKTIHQNCGIAYTLSVLDGRWKISILSFLLNQGKLRYSDLKSRLTGISERMLVSKLKELERDQLIIRHIYPQVPPRVEYELTELGQSFRKIIQLMDEWGEQNNPYKK